MGDRREFLKVAVAAGLVAKFGYAAQTANASGIPTRTLGHTGQQVSMLGIGGSHIGNPSQAEAIKIIRAAADNGITFMDNCWDYHDGDSEVRMGMALRDGYRQKVFLMTKIDGRDAGTAAEQIDQSLQRLQTDHLDLLQFHEVIRMNDPERIFAPGGGMDAAVKARAAGKVRFIGFTGHKSPQIHKHMLEVADQHQFKFDTVQMPLNVMDAQYESFAQIVLPMLLEKNIGVLGMKPIGAGILLKSGKITAVECLRYALSLPTSVVITGCESMKDLQQALELGRNFQPLTESERAALLTKTAEVAKNGEFEKYKTSTMFDGTTHNPQWLG
ncbi:MAG TPA: aldo/keto reductase [Terriglobales bacterium]